MESRFKIMNDRIIFDCNKLKVFLLIIPLGMFISGIQLILGLMPFEENYMWLDVFGLVFACIWTTVVGVMSFYLVFNIFKKTIVDSNGITVTFLAYKKEFAWMDVKDYGLSYSGKARGDGNIYDLYFSTKEQEFKNKCRKKLKGNMIKVIIVEDDYQNVIEKIIPFCQTKTCVTPFIGENRFHLL